MKFGNLVSYTRARPAPLALTATQRKTPAPLPPFPPPIPSLHVQAFAASPTHRINKFPFSLSVAIPPETNTRFWFNDASFQSPVSLHSPGLRCGTHVLSVHDKKLILTGRSTAASLATLITSLKRTGQISSRSCLLVPTPLSPFSCILRRRAADTCQSAQVFNVSSTVDMIPLAWPLTATARMKSTCSSKLAKLLHYES